MPEVRGVRLEEDAVGAMKPPRRAFAARVLWAGGRLASAASCLRSASCRFLERVLAAGADGGTGGGVRLLRFLRFNVGLMVGRLAG